MPTPTFLECYSRLRPSDVGLSAHPQASNFSAVRCIARMLRFFSLHPCTDSRTLQKFSHTCAAAKNGGPPTDVMPKEAEVKTLRGCEKGPRACDGHQLFQGRRLRSEEGFFSKKACTYEKKIFQVVPISIQTCTYLGFLKNRVRRPFFSLWKK